MPVRMQVAKRVVGGAEEKRELALDGEVIAIGRDRACQVVLSEQSISRTHARVTRDGSLYFVEDAGSAFGTRVNGQALPRGEKRLLRNGDVIAVGVYDLTFSRLPDVAEREGNEKTAAVARAVVKDVMRGLASGSGPYLRAMNGPLEGQRFEVTDARELVIGRNDECDIVLDDDLVSRRHAKIRRDWAGSHVEDMGSRNGVKVNKRAIARPVTLKDRDEVEIGGTRMLYVDPSEVRETSLAPPQGDPPRPSPAPEPAKPPETGEGLDGHEQEGAAGEDEGASGVAEPDEEAVAPEPVERVNPGNLLERMRALPRDREALKRMVPLLIAGCVGLVGLAILVVLFVAS